MIKLGTAVFLCFLLILGCDRDSGPESTQVLADLEAISISTQFDPLAGDELQRFRGLVADARVVSLGQSRHDISEQLKIQAMLSRNLVSDLGFRVVILEESFSHGLALDHYVATGDGDLRSILNNVAGWYLWDTEEVVSFFEWVRRFNETEPQGGRVHVFGMDITAPALGVRRAAAVAEALDPGSNWASLEYGLDLHAGDMWPQSLQRYSRLTQEESETIGKNLASLSEFLAGRAGGADATEEMRLAALEAEIGVRAHNMFSAAGMAAIGAAREDGMVANVNWILQRAGKKARAVIWTHNLHAARSSFQMPQLVEGDLVPMGVLLNRHYGSKYVAMGAAFGSGEFPANLPPGKRSFSSPDRHTVDGAIGALGFDAALLILAGLPESSSAHEWLSVEREWRMQDTSVFLSPLRGFDAIYYVDTVTRAQLTPLALQRHSPQAD